MAGPRGPRGIRVIAGAHRGRRLAVPKGDLVRPTQDRVKAAVFSALDARHALVDATILDLFSGTGSLAIEALSRGARRAVLVEHDREALRSIDANIERCGLGGVTRVVARDAASVLAGAPPGEAPFDVVFLDPPYDAQAAAIDELTMRLAAPGWLAADAMVVVERSARSAVALPPGMEMTWERTFGDTLIALMHRPAAA